MRQVQREAPRHTPDRAAWDAQMAPLERSLQPVPAEALSPHGGTPVGEVTLLAVPELGDPNPVEALQGCAGFRLPDYFHVISELYSSCTLIFNRLVASTRRSLGCI